MNEADIKRETQKVLFTTSIIVYLPDEDFERFLSISEQLREAVASAFKDDESVEPTGVIAYNYFDEPTTNVGKCAQCDDWVSNREAANTLPGLASAILVDGKLICDECRL
jgi:hypothetical protein